MMNFKQEAVIHKKLHDQFPETKIVDISELGSNSFWITITEPSDEDKQLKLDSLIAELSTDVLMDYGFEFQFVPITLAKVG